MPTQNELDMLKALPLDLKILKSKQRIREWIYEYGKDNVYISFSGGKDSTVLANLIRQEFPTIPLVFVDTGLEYPEIKEFVKTFDNVTTLRPKLSFLQVIEKYGFPIISKEVSEMIYQVHQYKDSNPKLIDKRLNGVGKNKIGKIPNKWMPLLNSSFKIGNGCCNVMKKSPVKSYERKFNKVPFVGIMTEESRQRKQSWLKHGCNAFDSKRPISMPISFWTEQDVLRYIKDNNITIASVYGDIIENEEGKLETTKCDRTGCVFCLYGISYEEGENRIERLKRTHNQLYNFLINKMNVGKMLDEVNRLCGTNIKY